jgi:hypothetical protein
LLCLGEFVNFNAIASFDEVYSCIVALITFFTMLKFLKLLRFNKRIGMLSKSLRYAQQDLSSFGFVFMIFMVAYAIMGFAVFGRSLQSYKSFFTALTTCFRMLLGEINAPDMFAVSRLYGKYQSNYLWFSLLDLFHRRCLLFRFVYHSRLHCLTEHLLDHVSSEQRLLYQKDVSRVVV